MNFNKMRRTVKYMKTQSISGRIFVRLKANNLGPKSGYCRATLMLKIVAFIEKIRCGTLIDLAMLETAD
jgi:hypothetical protein